MMAASVAESELAELLVRALNLEHILPAKVDPSAPLFGSHTDGWGLDSIDALEIALTVQQNYGVELRSEDEAVRPAFATLRTLSALIQERRPSR
ncbi:MAG: phosphopantetheine-binding protein [Panacagrimonas sp.]